MVKMSSYSKIRAYSVNKLNTKKKGKRRIIVVIAKCSISAGAAEVLKAVQDTVKEEEIENVIVEITGCIGLCHMEPIVIVEDLDHSKIFYDLVTPEKAKTITLVHGLYGNPVYQWTIKDSLDPV